ncbi:MAG: FecR domain-containing protein [Balneolales bacterium]
MNEDIDYNLIARYLAGECSDLQEKAIESWIHKNPEQKAMIQTFKKHWNKQKRQSQAGDIGMAWERLSRKMDKDSSPQRVRPARRTLPSQKKNVRWLSQPVMKKVLRVAAAIMVVGFASYYYSQPSHNTSPITGELMEEVVTERGQRAHVQLDDGSRVQLSVDSKLEHPREFVSDTRTVHLTGEAYFEIAHDGRPFLVHTDEAVIQVLGTEFNVQAYDVEQVQVVVADGKVAVRSASAPDAGDAILERGDMAQMHDGGHDFIITHEVDLQHHLNWLEHRLSFNDVPLEKVVRELERWYNVDINLFDPKLKDLRFTADFENEPIREVLGIMKYSLQLEYEVDGREITLFNE